METKDGASSWRQMKLDEDAHFFDFIAFYKRVEFCDRSIQLEILEEYRKASKDGDAEMTDVPSGKAGVQSAASEGKGETLGEPAASMKEAGEADQRSEERLEIAEGGADKGKDLAAGNGPKAGVEEDAFGGKESGSESSEKVPGTPSESGGEDLKDQEKPEKAPEASGENEAWVEVIPVNSIVLAAKSCVLRTMLSNGMRESDASAPVVLKVTPQEKEAFKELLHFIYVGSLSPQFLRTDANIRELVDLLIVGDKFEVGSLMGAVLKAFAKRGRTISDSIVLALEIPDALEQHPEVKAVIKEARTHVVETFKDVESWAESLEFLTLKQVVVSFLLQSEELDAASEEDIFQGVLVWVRNNLEGTAERQGAMRDLSLHLRFGLMRGEFLLKQVLPLLEMALPAVQERVRLGIYFQAFSDPEKLKTTDPSNQPRAGIQGRQLEILCNFKLDEAGSRKASPSAEWVGKNWRIEVHKDDRKDPPTVGVFLTPSKLLGADTFTPSRVRFSSYVRVWPTGYWKVIRGFESYVFKESDVGFGRPNALGMSWDEARKSSYYLNSTGELTVKIIVRNRKLLEEAEKDK